MPVDTQTRLMRPVEYVPRHLAADPEPAPQPAPVELAEVHAPVPTLYGHTPAAQVRALKRRVMGLVQR